MNTFAKYLISMFTLAAIVLVSAYTISVNAQDEPKAILVKSSSPEVAKAISDAIAKSEFKTNDFRMNLPKSGRSPAIARGSLARKDIVQLEKTARVSNRRFGNVASDIIVLVKVITKGSTAERLVRDALRGIDSKLYQVEVVR